MRITLGRLAVRRPARVTDADAAGERLAQKPGLQIAQLALGAATAKVPIFDGGNAG